MTQEVCLFRLSHRKERDKRITTHLFLTSRLFGIKQIWYSGERDKKIESTLNQIEEKWGRSLEGIEYVSKPKAFLERLSREYILIHLTMYGIPYKDILKELSNKDSTTKLCIIVGSEKVPGYVYDISHYNVSVGLTPHSEITSFALFMYELRGCKIKQSFKDAKFKIIPMKKGKRIEKIK